MQVNAERLLARLALAAAVAMQAERYIHDALGRLMAKGFAIDISECLDVLAAVAATQESFEEAARLLGAAVADREQLGIIRFPPSHLSGPPSSAPPGRRWDSTATKPRSPRGSRWEPTRRSPTSAGPGANESAHHAVGTA